DDVLGCGSYVVKTHYPFFGASRVRHAAIDRLAHSAVVVRPRRPAPDVRRSATAMGLVVDGNDLDRRAAAFAAFWDRYPACTVEFAALTDGGDAYDRMIADLGSRLG